MFEWILYDFAGHLLWGGIATVLAMLLILGSYYSVRVRRLRSEVVRHA